MSILARLFGPKRREDLSVVVYTRAGCHLCDDAWDAIAVFQEKYHFQLAARDIDAEPLLREQFDTCVPVIEVNGKVRMRGRFNGVLFQRLMDAPP